VSVSSPAEADVFNGPYVGVGGGYESYSGDLNGATYQVHAGWDVKVAGRLVLGAELRLGDSTAENVERRETATFTDVATTRINQQIGGQLRAGYLATDRVLIYASGGGERFKVDAATVRTPKPPCTNCTPNTQDFSFKEKVWTVGGGVEVGLSDRFRLRAAYSYADGDAYHRHSLSASLGVSF
jgi:opacity protein-like surface antigen